MGKAVALFLCLGLALALMANTKRETEYCHEQRKMCEEQCGDAVHVDFKCVDDGKARSSSCACSSQGSSSGASSHASASSTSKGAAMCEERVKTSVS